MNAHAPGTPSWVDLGSPDLDASIRFYGQLFGWEAVRGGPETAGYTICTRNGRAVAGLGPLMSEAQPTVWTSYVATDDAEVVVARVATAGGSVIIPAVDVLHLGRMALFADQAGATIGVWQAGSMPGMETEGEPGTLSWIELATRDVAGAQRFYGEVFGWQTRELPHPDTRYLLWQRGDVPVAGMVEMNEQWPVEASPHWSVYFNVADCDATVKRAGELGASVAVPPTDIPAGRFAVLDDPVGAVFSVIRPNPDYRP